MPMMTSLPPCTCCWTRQPHISASGMYRVARYVMRSKESRTSAGILHIEPYAADICLVKDIGRGDLHDHGVADLVGESNRLVCRAQSFEAGTGIL